MVHALVQIVVLLGRLLGELLGMLLVLVLQFPRVMLPLIGVVVAIVLATKFFGG